MAATVTPEITVTLADLTTGSVDGTGAFDVLMRTMGTQLQKEFDAGRITGADYSNAYVQMMQVVSQTSLSFAMGKDMVGYQIEGTKAQTASELERGGFR